MKIFALKVKQPLGEFYISVLPANVLANRVRNRPRSSGVERSEDIQRVFSDRRVDEIADFSRDPQATFPTPVILAVDSATIREVACEYPQDIANPAFAPTCFDIPDTGIIGDVLDGQHRVLGLERSAYRDEFELPVVFMFDLSLDDKAFVFSIINSKQTPVSGSLIYDLFDLSKFPSPQKTCHYLAQSLNNQEGGPFFRRLKMLGRKEDHHGENRRVMLSQGSFSARLEGLISKTPMEDATLLKQGVTPKEDSRCPLRKYFLIRDDESILKILTNFFSAAESTFKVEWQDEKGVYVIRKTVGYTALIIVLRHVLEEGFVKKDLSKGFFLERFGAYKNNIGNVELTNDNFSSSGGEAIRLAKLLLGVDKLLYPVAEAPDPEDLILE